MATVCAGQVEGRQLIGNSPLIKTVLHILVFSHMEALGYVRLYNILYAISYGDK